ncbi:FIST signal transduction protein [Candidatus Omnitrophota bacterium]
MTTSIGIGFSNNPNPQKAAFETAQQAASTLPSTKANFAILFVTIHYDPKILLPIIADILETTNIIGCSTAAVISSDKAHLEGVSLLAVESTDINFCLQASDPINALNAREQGFMLAQNCIKDFKGHTRNSFLCLIDGLLQEKSPFIRGLQEGFGNVFPIVGAGSCDDFHLKQSFQIHNTKVLTASACGILFGGNSSIGTGSRHGWRPLGKPRIVTDVQNSIIKTIDNQPAASFLENFFDIPIEQLISSDNIKASILYPLGIHVEENNEYLLRNILKVYRDGSILCQGDVEVGSEIHVMIGNKDTCKDAAKLAATEAKRTLMGKQAKFVLLFESMARLKLFGHYFSEELIEIKNVFGPDVPIWGMCSDGEICPFQINERFKQPLLQNASVSILAIS